MQVKLKVIGGKNDGREIKITVPEFIIGRGEQAHLRPNSDLISRQHCAIRQQNGRVILADLGSRNGTFVNGEQIRDDHVAKPGDILRVGRLQFEVMIDIAEPSHKKPKVEGIAQVAARTAASANDAFDEESITSWLTQPAEADQDDRTSTIHDTGHFPLEDSTTRLFVRSKDLGSASDSGTEQPAAEDSKSMSFFRKKQAGKLPKRPTKQSDSSTTAADEVLRKFFNRR